MLLFVLLVSLGSSCISVNSRSYVSTYVHYYLLKYFHTKGMFKIRQSPCSIRVKHFLISTYIIGTDICMYVCMSNVPD